MREHTYTYTMRLLEMYFYLHDDNVQTFQRYKRMKGSKVFGLLPNNQVVIYDLNEIQYNLMGK